MHILLCPLITVIILQLSEDVDPDSSLAHLLEGMWVEHDGQEHAVIGFTFTRGNMGGTRRPGTHGNRFNIY